MQHFVTSLSLGGWVLFYSVWAPAFVAAATTAGSEANLRNVDAGNLVRRDQNTHTRLLLALQILRTAGI